MKLTSRWKAGIAALIAAGTVFGAAAVSDVASALPPGTPPFQPGGGVTLAPSSGSFASVFPNFVFNPVNQACPGDNNSGWAFSPYLTADDPAQLVFSAQGSPTSPLGGRTAVLRDTGGNLIRGLFPNLVDGLITAMPNISFASTFATTPLAPGVYNVGVACFNGVYPLDANGVPIRPTDNPAAPPTGNGLDPTRPAVLPVRENARFWNTQITATSSTGSTTVSDTFAVGTAPVAPVLSLGAGTGTEQTINLVADSTVTSYTVNVTPAPGGALPTVAPGATSFELTGLSLGTSYTVTLTANKTGFTPVTSSPLTFSAAATTPAPVVTALNVIDGDPLTASWTQPAGPVAPTNYTVVLTGGSPAITPISQTVAALTTSFGVQPVGSYTVSVTPNYPAGSGLTGTTGTDGVDVTPGALVKQELTVTRPAGALILTQRCGVFNDLDAFTAVPDFPGFPFNLGAESATLNQTGTAPIDDATGAGDLEFPNYPLPNPNYGAADPLATAPFGNVTTCGLDMGVARFVTEGNISAGGPTADNLIGNFFAASGRLNEVTVLDTRDIDAGWELRGDIEDRFISTTGFGDSFSGNYLGWEPVMTDDSEEVGGEGPGVNGAGALYDQTVLAGPTVLPGDGFPADAGFPNIGAIGMTDNPLLAQAAGGAGLGISTHDARLLVLIPASRDAGNYSATLTLTVG